MSPGRDVAVALLILALLSGARTDGQTPALAEVMRRVHSYVSVYEDHELSTVMARERYHQQLLASDAKIKAERIMLSDYLLIQLLDEDWVALRDVYEVDGVAVGSRTARLRKLFTGPRDQLGERAMKMAEETAAFNLGDDYYRTVNLPTYALRMLRPADRKRMAFTQAGEERVADTTTWVIAFRETKGPTFSATPEGTDVPAHGRFWVDPITGVVVQSEMILGETRGVPARATITVTYRHEPSLGFRIPFEMLERYEHPGRRNDEVVTAHATYSDFRRFDWRAFANGNNPP